MTVRDRIHPLGRHAVLLGLGLAFAGVQPVSAQSRPLSPGARTVLAVTYPFDHTLSIELEGTARLPDASGEAKVERKRGATEIEIELDEMKPADRFGGDYNTYLLWAASPEGQVDNLGEFILRGNRSKLNVTTPLETFGLFVTAEPHYLVGSPSPFVVLENVRSKNPSARARTAAIVYPGFEGDYRFDRRSLEDVDETTATVHPHLAEARTAIDLALRAEADRHAKRELQLARDALIRAEVMSESEDLDDGDDLMAQAHEAVRLAVLAGETAERTTSEVEVALRERDIAEKEARIRELESRRASAETEAERARLSAEQQRLRAELEAERAARAEIQASETDRRLRQSETSLAERDREIAGMERRLGDLEEQTARAKTEAERSRLLVEQQQLRAQLEGERAAEAELRARREMEGRLAAEDEVRQLRLEREEARRELQATLERILEVRETARGLVMNIPNVLFDLDRATLKPEGREKLSQVAAVLDLATGYRLSIEGHADNTGTREYNLDLSLRRAEAVRDYLLAQGIGGNLMRIEAFGEDRPIAGNSTAEGRQLNRRVEVVVEELPEFNIIVREPTDSKERP
jgi:outer membrane protein OmpA-like peptidoglycan-associated protein